MARRGKFKSEISFNEEEKMIRKKNTKKKMAGRWRTSWQSMRNQICSASGLSSSGIFFLAFLRRRKGGKNIQELNFFSLAFQSSSPSDCSVADNISHFNWPARFFLFFFFCFWSGRQQQQIEWFPSPICKKKIFQFWFPLFKGTAQSNQLISATLWPSE